MLDMKLNDYSGRCRNKYFADKDYVFAMSDLIGQATERNFSREAYRDLTCLSFYAIDCYYSARDRGGSDSQEI